MPIKGEAWRTENWWVSPWNFAEEAAKDFKHPGCVKIYDVTTRDGEQQAGIVFSKDDKIRIAEKLAALGVQRIEPAMPVVSAEDEMAVKEIVKRNLGPEVFVGCRSIVDEIKRAADCGVKGVTIGTPVSQHLIEYGLGWPLERALEHAIKATSAAGELGLQCNFFPIDGSRAERNWYLSFVEKVAREGHMDALVVADTMGALSPHGVSCFVREVKKRIDKPVHVHFHNTFGLAVANTVAGVLSGAEVIHTAVTGIGEGAGNCCLEEVVITLLALYGIDTGIHYEKLYETSKLVRELAGVAPNRPFVGDRSYAVETGEAVLVYRNAYGEHPTVLFPVHPRFVGHPEPEIVIGKKTGIDGVEIWASRLGIELTREEGRKVVAEVKRLASDSRRLLSEEEFLEIASNVKAARTSS